MKKRTKFTLVAVAITCFLFGTFALLLQQKMQIIQAERAIIARLEPRGFDFQRDYSGFFHIAALAHCDKAFGLNIAVDADLKDVGQLSKITSLGLSCSGITDAGVAHISGLNELQHLTLDHTQITDDTLKIISDLPRLRTLTLSSTAVTDKGLLLLAKMTTLESIQLTCDGVTDTGIQEFRELCGPRFVKIHR